MTTKTLIYRIKTSYILLLFSVLFSASVDARQLDDVVLPDNVTLDGTSEPLQLNGMGYRTKFVFNVYVAALYTETKADSRDAVQALKGPKRVLMHMVHDEVSQKKMAAAWREGFEENNSDEQFKKLESRLNTFISYFPVLKKGDVVALQSPNSLAYPVIVHGALKAGLTLTNINPLYTADEANHQAGSDQAVGSVIDKGDFFAHVGEQTLSKQDYLAKLRYEIRQKFFHAKVPEKQMEKFRETVGRQLVNRTLLIQEAKRQGIKPDEAAIKNKITRLEDRKKNDPYWQKNQKRLLPGVREQYENDSLLKLIEKKIRDVPEPSEKN